VNWVTAVIERNFLGGLWLLAFTVKIPCTLTGTIWIRQPSRPTKRKSPDTAYPFPHGLERIGHFTLKDWTVPCAVMNDPFHASGLLARKFPRLRRCPRR